MLGIVNCIKKKLSKKSYPQISDEKNIIQKFYPKMFLSKMYATYSMSLYIITLTWTVIQYLPFYLLYCVQVLNWNCTRKKETCVKIFQRFPPEEVNHKGFEKDISPFLHFLI